MQRATKGMMPGPTINCFHLQETSQEQMPFLKVLLRLSQVQEGAVVKEPGGHGGG